MMAEPKTEQHHVVKALSEYKEKLGLAEDDNFYQKIIDESLNTISNRIPSQAGNIPNESLHNHIIEIFKPFTDDVPVYSSQKLLSNQRETCILTVKVERAENLAPKDVSGTSDPYCLLGLSPKESYKNLQGKIKKYTQKTNYKESTLNPVWNETFKFKVQRSDVNNLALHMHVWDYDETDDTMTSALGRVKDVKNFSGFGRIVKDVAQTVSSSTDQDDFMGFALMPLRQIAFGTSSKWFDLRSHSTLERVSGRIKVAIHLTCPHHSVLPDIPFSYSAETLRHDDHKPNNTEILSHCAIFGGLVTVTVASAHNNYKELLMQQGEKSSTTCDGWNGSVGNLSYRLLDEFKSQRCVSDKQDVISRWHTYTWEHVQLKEGLKLKFMTDLMSELEEVCKREEVSCQDVVDSRISEPLFTMDNLPTSFEEFINHEKEKIVVHRELHPVKQNDTIIKTGELLMCFRTLRNMKLYMTLKMIDTTMKSSADVRDDVIAALKTSAKNLFDESCMEFKVFGANIANINEDTDIYEEYNVVGIARLVDHLNHALVDGYSYYHGVYEKVLNINYIATIKDVIIPLLHEDLENILDKINAAIVNVIDPKDKKAEERASGMFLLYQNLKYLSSFLVKLSANNLNNNIIIENRDHVNPETFEGYHNWFRPTLLRWLQVSRLKTLDNLRSAVKVDKVDRLDNIAKHSSSSVDAVACLTAITTIWQKMDWPDAVDCFVLVTRITSDIASAVEHYADLVHDKLKSVGFFDDEGQFDVTEELCFALNNLERVKAFLQKLPSDLNIDKVASNIDLLDKDNIDGEKFKSTFHALLRNAEVEMRRKMLIVIAIVGKKLLPDVTKYLETFCAKISDDEDDEKTNWEKSVDVAITKLREYLAENISTLFMWLCESNFRLLLDVLWRVCLRSFQDVVLEKQTMRRPLFFKKLRYVLSDHINEFFYAEGRGIPHEAMQTCETFLYVDAELKLKGAKSVDLMRLFYAEMYESQCKDTGGSEFGYLNVNAWYERSTGELHVDVVSAENLVSLDVNGLSDPFVKLRLAPKLMFPETRTFQTLVEKKTLNPVYKNEKFTFKLTSQYVQQEGAVLIFTVLDHDIITANDLEGEAALPLHILDGVSDKTQSRSYKLKLSQPASSPKKPWYDFYLNKLSTAVSDDDVSDVLDKGSPKSRTFATPLSLLNCRVDYDRDAAEFCRWRAKLEQAMQERTGRLHKS